jgi:hypothetical protein
MDRTDVFVFLGLAIFVVGQVLDSLTTWRVMSIDRLYEMNGFLVMIFDAVGVVPGLILFKGGLTLVFIVVYLFYRYYRPEIMVSGSSIDLRPFFGFVFLVGGSLYLFYSLNNFYLIRSVGESLLV